jgi:hypothetical protein
VAEVWWLRAGTGEPCGPGTRRPLLEAAGTAAATQDIAAEHTWNRPESRTIAAGVWTVRLWITTAGGGGAAARVTVTVERVNQWCGVIETLHSSQTGNLPNGATSEAVWSFNAGEVAFEPGDLLIIRALRTNGSRATTLHFNDANSLVEHPDAVVAPTGPGPASNLAATLIQARRVDLSWSPGEGATGYRVERQDGVGDGGGIIIVGNPDTDPVATWAPIGITGTASFSDTTVEPSKFYEYRVIASDGAALSEPSNVVEVATPAEVVGAVDVGFAGTVPLQSLDVALRATIPLAVASFDGAVPLQSLQADLGAMAPAIGVGFSGAVPVQELEANLDAQAPTVGIGFEGTVPVQTLDTTLGASSPASGMTFAGAVPVQTFEAEMSAAVPVGSVSFAGAVPLQGLTATTIADVPIFEAVFTGEVPLQGLAAEAEFSAAEPGAVRFYGTVPLQTLTAIAERTIPARPITFVGAIPLQTLQADAESLHPSADVGFLAPVPLQRLVVFAETEVVGGIGIDFAGTIPVQDLHASLGEVVQAFELETARSSLTERETVILRTVERETYIVQWVELTTRPET